MNVAATRAKEEFYIISDRKLYLGLGCDVATDTDRIIREYKNQYLVDDHAHKNELRMQVDETRTLIIDADLDALQERSNMLEREQKVFMPM